MLGQPSINRSVVSSFTCPGSWGFLLTRREAPNLWDQGKLHPTSLDLPISWHVCPTQTFVFIFALNFVASLDCPLSIIRHSTSVSRPEIQSCTIANVRGKNRISRDLGFVCLFDCSATNYIRFVFLTAVFARHPIIRKKKLPIYSRNTTK